MIIYYILLQSLMFAYLVPAMTFRDFVFLKQYTDSYSPKLAKVTTCFNRPPPSQTKVAKLQLQPKATPSSANIIDCTDFSNFRNVLV